MSLAVCLLAYSMVITVFGPPLLASITARGAAPRLGVTVWLVMMATVLSAWIAAVVMSTAQIVDSWDDLGRVLTGCVAGLRLVALGGSGPLLQIVLLGLAGFSVAALLVVAARLGTALHRAGRHSRAHAQAARLAAGATPAGPAGSLVIDSAHRAVYCLAGRPNTVVVTRAALETLTDDQLAAVLAHEHAHLAGEHHRLLALTTALGRILSPVRLFSDGAADIARLLEMCADDAAARHHGRDTVADALIALALPTPTPPLTPAVAMGAASVGVAERVERLFDPPAATPTRIALTLTLAAVLLGPALAAGMTVLVPMLCAS